VGVVLSVLVGLANDGLCGGTATTETLTSTEGRLKGGLGDPNILAAAIVPAIVLAAALILIVRASVRVGAAGVHQPSGGRARRNPVSWGRALKTDLDAGRIISYSG
jgi:hypothetical protein